MKKYIITPLLLWCLASAAWADVIQLRENHPDRYVVVKGDTLWDISARFLKDPWLWPQVWKMNREQIRNPHLIYPGDVVVLDLSGATPQLRLLRGTVKLEPGTRIEPLDKQAIPTIAPSVIAPFLSQPLIIAKDELEGTPKIVGAEDGRLLLAPGMKVYADKVTDGDGIDWQIFRAGKPLIDPDSKEELGVETIYLGDARTVKYGEPATVEIRRIKQDVALDDRLITPPDAALETFVPHAPDEEIRGRIVSTYEGASDVGRNSIVAINRGAADGLEVGHVLAIYREGASLPPSKSKDDDVKSEGYVNLERNDDGSLKRDEEGRVQTRVGTRRTDGKPDPAEIKLPDERVGLLMIFRTFERVSYGLVMQSERQIHAPDIVATP
ncbi:MAG TPA: LysM peptidoglycan-binding domain-containing protein [Methylophilaceae bacterium]|nr:LysM peptidoglycan-binding domain-containing protein [Methylophilaceae bacterium]